MTSRTSFSRLIKPTLKKSYTWFIVSGIYVLISAMSDLLRTQSFVNDTVYNSDVPVGFNDNVASLCSPYQSSSELMLAFVLGACLALHYFPQLYAKKQADFYGAFPISRKMYWGLSAVCSLIIFGVFGVIVGVIRMAITVGYGGDLGIAFKMTIATLICSALSFLLSWTTMTLATVLTGNVIVACIGYLAICMYAPLMVGQVISSMASMFFRTFVDMDLQVYNYLSPAANAMLLKDFDGESWSFSGKTTLIVVIVVMIVGFGLLSLKLFENRALEKTGTAMAFKHSMPVIKFMIAIPIALTFGLFFVDLSTMSYAWLYSGIILGAFLANGITESIYRFDIRGMISSWKHLLAIIAIAVAISLVFIMDLTGFNTRIPNVDAIKAITITNDSTYDTLYSGYNDDRRPEQTKEEKEDMLEFVSYLTKNYSESKEVEPDMLTVNVKYDMNNGKRIERAYLVTNNDEYRAAFAKMFDKPEFKQNFYELYAISKGDILGAYYDDTINTTKLALNKKKMAELAEIYKSELNTLDYNTVYNQPTLGTLTFDADVIDSEGQKIQNSYTCYLYPSFTKTLNYLEKSGVKTGSVFDNYKMVDFRITEISKLAMVDDYDESYLEDSSFSTKRSDISIDSESAYNLGKKISRAELESVLNLKTDLVPTYSCQKINPEKYNDKYVITARLKDAQIDDMSFYVFNGKAVEKLAK